MAHDTAHARSMAMINHYEVLGLATPRTGGALATTEDVKQAYRLALLKHHPDKHGRTPPSANGVSIDAIKAAFAVLSDPQLRAEHDRALALWRGPGAEGRRFHTGEESVDLDDLEWDAEQAVWFRGCRCGEERGYVVTEPQLEEEARTGGREVVVGCKGCSLWTRLSFGVVEEHEDDESAQDGHELSKS